MPEENCPFLSQCRGGVGWQKVEGRKEEGMRGEKGGKGMVRTSNK